MIKRIVIAGSRTYTDYYEAEAFLRGVIAEFPDCEVVIVSGGCRGADTIGELFAVNHGLSVERYPAQWERFGKSAGPIRNMEMAKICDLAVCFWDGKSRGTRFMIDYCKKLGKKVIVKLI